MRGGGDRFAVEGGDPDRRGSVAERETERTRDVGARLREAARGAGRVEEEGAGFWIDGDIGVKSPSGGKCGFAAKSPFGGKLT